MNRVWWNILYKHCTIVGKVISTGGMGQQLQYNAMFTTYEQLRKWMANSGNQISHWWSGSLQITKGKRLGLYSNVLEWDISICTLIKFIINMVKYEKLYILCTQMSVCPCSGSFKGLEAMKPSSNEHTKGGQI